MALVKNRWEGFVPVPPGVNSVDYRFKFEYKYNRHRLGAQARQRGFADL